MRPRMASGRPGLRSTTVPLEAGGAKEAGLLNLIDGKGRE